VHDHIDDIVATYVYIDEEVVSTLNMVISITAILLVKYEERTN